MLYALCGLVGFGLGLGLVVLNWAAISRYRAMLEKVLTSIDRASPNTLVHQLATESTALVERNARAIDELKEMVAKPAIDTEAILGTLNRRFADFEDMLAAAGSAKDQNATLHQRIAGLEKELDDTYARLSKLEAATKGFAKSINRTSHLPKSMATLTTKHDDLAKKLHTLDQASAQRFKIISDFLGKLGTAPAPTLPASAAGKQKEAAPPVVVVEPVN